MANSSSSNTNGLVAARAVLVSHFPPKFNNETLIPKLKALNVDVLRVVSIERAGNYDTRNVDVVLCMKDLMSHASFELARDIAVKASVTFMPLTRKAAAWESKLTKLVQRLQPEPAPTSKRPGTVLPFRSTRAPYAQPMEVQEPEPPSVDDLEMLTPDQSEVLLEDTKELLALFADENVNLEAEKTELARKLALSDDLASVLEKQVQVLRRDGDALASQLAIADTARDALREERDEARSTCAELRAELSSVFADVEALRVAKPAGIDKAALFRWGNLLHAARENGGSDLLALLQFASEVGVTTAELFEQLQQRKK